MAESAIAAQSGEPGGGRRDFLYLTAGAMGAVAVGPVAWPIIDSMNPISWVRTARELRRIRPRLIVFQWWHPFFCFSFGSIVRLLDRELQSRVVASGVQ